MDVLIAVILIAALASTGPVRRAVPTESGLVFALITGMMMLLLFAGRLA